MILASHNSDRSVVSAARPGSESGHPASEHPETGDAADRVSRPERTASEMDQKTGADLLAARGRYSPVGAKKKFSQPVGCRPHRRTRRRVFSGWRRGFSIVFSASASPFLQAGLHFGASLPMTFSGPPRRFRSRMRKFGNWRNAARNLKTAPGNWGSRTNDTPAFWQPWATWSFGGIRPA